MTHLPSTASFYNQDTMNHLREGVVRVLGVAVFCLYLLYMCILLGNGPPNAPSFFFESTATDITPIQSIAAEICALEDYRVSFVLYITWADLCGVKRIQGV